MAKQQLQNRQDDAQIYIETQGMQSINKQRFTCRLPCSKCAGQKQCSSIQKPSGHGCSNVHITKHTTCRNVWVHSMDLNKCIIATVPWINTLLYSLSPQHYQYQILLLVFQSCEQPRRKQSNYFCLPSFPYYQFTEYTILTLTDLTLLCFNSSISDGTGSANRCFNQWIVRQSINQSFY